MSHLESPHPRSHDHSSLNLDLADFRSGLEWLGSDWIGLNENMELAKCTMKLCYEQKICGKTELDWTG